MKPLSKSFTKRGFVHEMVERNGDIAIFQRKAPHHQAAHYEVIIVQKYDARTIAGVEIPASEGYPWAEQWGTAGWTYGTLDSARTKFNALIARAALQVEIPEALSGLTTIQSPSTIKTRRNDT